MFFFNAGIINALKRSRRFRQSMSERKSDTPTRIRDKPWKSKNNDDDDSIGQKLTGKRTDSAEEKVSGDREGGGKCGGDRSYELGSNVAQKSFDMDTADADDEDVEKGVLNFETGSNVAQKSFDMDTINDYEDDVETSGETRDGFHLRFEPGSNDAQKSFIMDTAGADVDDDESSVPRIVVNEEPYAESLQRQERGNGPSELRSTPSPAGTPVMTKRQSPVRIQNTPARRLETRKQEEADRDNCPPCFRRIFCRCFSIKG